MQKDKTNQYFVPNPLKEEVKVYADPAEIMADLRRRMSDPDLEARCQRWRLGAPLKPLPPLSDKGKGKS